MKKALLIVPACAVVLWLVLTLAVNDAKRTSVDREWPAGLGTIESVPKHFPKQPANATALELVRLARPAGVDFRVRRVPEPALQAMAEYLRSQIQRTDEEIDAPPESVRAFLEARGPQIAALRAHLLGSQTIRWEVDLERGAPMPNLLAHLHVQRILAASALDRGRRGDAAAWDDLLASRRLADGLWSRPELISSMIALAISRNTVAIARKMPLPAPEWLSEMKAFDSRKAMLRAMQADAWMIARQVREISETDDEANWIRRLGDRTIFVPYFELSRANLLAHLRETSTELSRVTACNFDAQAFHARRGAEVAWWNIPAKMATPNIAAAWQRLFRYRAELELTERALQLRRGEKPQTASRCSDGTWIVTADRVKFSREIPLPAAPKAAAPPLEFVLTR